MRTTTAAISDGAEQYMAAVAAALNAAGYRVTERFVEGADVFDKPDHVIRISLGGPTVDLIWDTLHWTIITYPYRVSTHSDDLSRALTDQEDPLPDTVVRLARPVLDEARRRWGKNDPEQTWTFFGHWDNARIVIDVIVPGEVADDREDDGRWPEGLWSTSNSGTTVEQAQKAALAECLTDPDDVADMVAHDAAVGFPGWSRVEEPEENTVAWAERVLTDVTPATRAQLNTAIEVPLFAMARTLRNRGPQVTWLQLLQSMLTDLIETVHGPGVAVEVEALMSWWRDLPDEKRAATGVPLERTFQPPARHD